ncbi:MAG: late competence development ComFB family protein [Leptospiraceae bacterium]|nr:late competence development ComFB family protein [Leptospiraceae bacterium]MCP5503032.1 late competence development ComFB family protein [Leptospiraceae bacterium]
MSEKNTIKLKSWTREIRNSVEKDLKEELKIVIMEHPEWGWEQLSLQDVYACAINQLPPIYVIGDEEPPVKLSRGEIKDAILFAMKRIEEHPMHI